MHPPGVAECQAIQTEWQPARIITVTLEKAIIPIGITGLRVTDKDKFHTSPQAASI